MENATVKVKNFDLQALGSETGPDSRLRSSQVDDRHRGLPEEDAR
jgi:hypothetical protein